MEVVREEVRLRQIVFITLFVFFSLLWSYNEYYVNLLFFVYNNLVIKTIITFSSAQPIQFSFIGDSQ